MSAQSAKIDRFGGDAIYQIFLRPFTAEGTLQAAEKRLPEVADLGVKIIYLCPVTVADPSEDLEFWTPRQKQSQCGNARNPYRLCDYTGVDPEYGTEEDLRSFIRTAHGLGLKVLMDLVFYHAGPTFAEKYPEFVDGIGHWLFPKLDFTSPALRKHLLDAMRYFIEDLEADGFRCDVSDGVPMDFWKESVRELRRSRPDMIMFAEGDKQIAEDQKNGIFDLNYHFQWGYTNQNICTGEQPVSALKEVWRNDGRIARLFDNHDIANDAYEKRLEAAAPSEAVDALIFLNFMMDGVPFLYNGVEYCDGARHSIYSFPGQFVIDRSRDAAERKALIRRMTALRQGEPILYQGSTHWEEVTDDVVKFDRDGVIFCTINFGKKEISLPLPEGAEWICQSRNAAVLDDGLSLPAFGFAAYRQMKLQ